MRTDWNSKLKGYQGKLILPILDYTTLQVKPIEVYPCQVWMVQLLLSILKEEITGIYTQGAYQYFISELDKVKGGTEDEIDNFLQAWNI